MGRLGAGHGKSAALAARAQNHPVGWQPEAALGFDGVRIDEARIARPLVQRYAQAIDVFTKRGVCAHVLDDLFRPSEKASVVEPGRADSNAVAAEVLHATKQARRVGQRPHGDRTIAGGHAAEIVARDERRPRPQLGGAECRQHAGWSGAYHHDVHWAGRSRIHGLNMRTTSLRMLWQGAITSASLGECFSPASGR